VADNKINIASLQAKIDTLKKSKEATKDTKKIGAYDKTIKKNTDQIKKFEDASTRINKEIEGVADAKKEKMKTADVQDQKTIVTL
jgi:predicted  nucleic acid-binding Zn-ribbon protein